MRLFDERIHQRYWDKVHAEPNTSCWLWVGASNKRGYGNIMDKIANFTWTSHRYFYTKLVGTIPAFLTVDHLCKTTCCVNPQHMELVSLEENTRRQNQPRSLHTGRFISRNIK